MLPGRNRNAAGMPALLAAAALLGLVPLPGHANPATVDYNCTPTLPGGSKISVDYNSGGKSVTLFYPNGESLRMPIQRSGSGFRYGEGNVGIAGKGQTTITLAIAGQPSRQCVTPR
jgi:membrane-bound inhibitor of C-type lysozyme